MHQSVIRGCSTSVWHRDCTSTWGTTRHPSAAVHAASHLDCMYAMLQPVCNVPVQTSDVHGDQTFKTETEFSRPRERDSDPTSDTETETEISASTSVSGPHFWGLIYNYKISYDNLTIIVRWSHKIFCKSGPWSRDRDWDRNFNVCGKGAVDLIIKMFPPLFTPLLRTLPITVCIETKLTSIGYLSKNAWLGPKVPLSTPVLPLGVPLHHLVYHCAINVQRHNYGLPLWCTTTPSLYRYTIWFTTTPSDVPLHHLLYHYTISQAQISDFQMLFVKDVYKLNYTIDQLRSEQCVLEVIVNVLIKTKFKMF